jgi:uncharacterized RDD family membrane protein YckC
MGGTIRMTTQEHWQAPEMEPGPAPGVAFASPGSRLVAYIVDVIVTIAVSIVLGIVGVALVFVLPILSIIPFLAIFIVSFVYFPYYWQRSGQTPGMRMMNIKVVRDSDGGPLSWGSAILRLIGYWVSGFVFYIGYIWIFIDKRKRGWHDLIAGTVVIESPSA